MTDDIVARLCDLGDHASFDPAMHHVAADEIERLRGALRDIALFSPYKHSSTLRRKARAALKEGEASHD